MVAYLTHSERDSFEKLAIMISVLSICSVCKGSECEGNFKGCCPGSLWNATSQQCERCMPGYTGENCSLTCPYPYYGVDCKRTCNCSRELCDSSTGCIAPTTENDTKDSQIIILDVQNATSRAMETSTFLSIRNNTVSTEKNYTLSDNKTQKSGTFKYQIILCIKIFGCVDILLIWTYSAMFLYDRQHRTVGKVNTYENVPGNNPAYENVETFFVSPTGNRLL